MIFVTGGSGLLGGHLLIHLLKRGEPVRALKRKNSSLNELKLICKYYQMDFEKIISQIEWVEGDLLDKNSLKSALRNIHTVYHCAAIVSFGNISPETLTRINVEGTHNLIEAAIEAHIFCFAFVSSIGALGHPSHNEITTEETPWNSENTSSIYSNSKYAAEQEVWKAAGIGLPVVIVNPGIILGAGDFSKGSLQLISQAYKYMPFYTHQKSGYVDVRDVCQVLITLVEKQIFNQRFVLVSENLTNKELFTFIAHNYRRKAPFIPVGRRALKFVSQLEKISSYFTGRQPLITPEIISSATRQESYSSGKLQNTIHLSFIPIKETVRSAISFMQKIKKCNAIISKKNDISF